MQTMLNDTKTAFIIAGPNGSGKTTFSISLLENTEILTGAHLNADIIAKAYMTDDDYKDLTPLEVHLKVSKLVDDAIDALIEQGSNIILETVFSSKYKLDTYAKLKKAGDTAFQSEKLYQDITNLLKMQNLFQGMRIV